MIRVRETLRSIGWGIVAILAFFCFVIWAFFCAVFSKPNPSHKVKR